MPKILTRNLKDRVVVSDQKSAIMILRGTYTLSGGSVAVTFNEEFSDTTDLIVLTQTDTANIQYPSGTTITGFTANGTGAETGSYLAVGNVKL